MCRKVQGNIFPKYIYTIETAVTNGNGSSSAVPQALATDDEIEVTAVIFKRGTSDFVWIADRLSTFSGAKIPLRTYRKNIQTVIAQMTEWLAAIPRLCLISMPYAEIGFTLFLLRRTS